jgi:CO/xanthine dehydrogenase Mo-binding subunit
MIHTAVGHSFERLDAAEKVTGEAQYVDDLYRPGMLHGAVLGSSHAHARIRGYKLDAARAIPGVAGIITGEDFEVARTGAFCKDEVPLARGKTIYLGEPVAAIAASDPETAWRAARAIEIDYEPLPSVLSIDEALASDAPLVHEDLANYVKIAPSYSQGNVLWQCRVEEGDINAAWAQCDVVVEDVFETAAQHHMYMEPCGALAEMDRSGRLTIWSSCQSVHLVQQRGPYQGAGAENWRRLRRQGRPPRAASCRRARAADGTARQIGAVTGGRLRDGAIAPSGPRRDEDRRQA